MDKELYALIAFSSTDIIGHQRLSKIRKHFPNINDFLEISVNDQMNLLGLTTEKSQKILSNMTKQADFIIQQCQQKNISYIPYNSSLYPKSLKEIIDPPYLLYSQGNFDPHIPLIGVIGTRKSTHEAEQINRHFCKHFVQYGFGIISGLAQGHDAIAAESVLKNDGYTVGVLGTAIDSIYPKNSQRLFHEMKEKGALLSEYPPGMVSTKWRFPRRNRLVSGMSQAICVIQAPKRSGTMITVNMAIDQNKDVYVIPGNPMVYQYEGSNYLISQGAKIALTPQHIIEEILQTHPNIETMQFIAQSKENEILNEEEQLETPSDCSVEEKQILELTKEHIHIDEISRTLEINIASLMSILTIMEIKGLIIQKPGQIYIKGI